MQNKSREQLQAETFYNYKYKYKIFKTNVLFGFSQCNSKYFYINHGPNRINFLKNTAKTDK